MVTKEEIESFQTKIRECLEGYRGEGRQAWLKGCLYSTSAGVRLLTMMAAHDAYGTPLPSHIYSAQWNTGEYRNSFMWFADQTLARSRARQEAVRMARASKIDPDHLVEYTREDLSIREFPPEIDFQVCLPDYLLTDSLREQTGAEKYWVENDENPSVFNAPLTYVNYRPVVASVNLVQLREESWDYLSAYSKLPNHKKASALSDLFEKRQHIYTWLYFGRKFQ